MNSVDSNDEGMRESLRLSARDFEMIFQVTKELHSLSEQSWAEVGRQPNEIVPLLSALRATRAQAESASIIRIDPISVNSGEAWVAAPVREASANPESGIGVEVGMQIPQFVLTAWYRLTDAIISELGEREIFLRTGYSIDELRDAIHPLRGIAGPFQDN